MALNKAQRNNLRNTVIKCRRLLEEATSEILEGRFGIQRSGEVEDLSQLTHLSDAELRYREQVVSYLLHTQAMGLDAKDAVARLVREASYTHLNRLCAYKMLEVQEALRQVVGRGLGSNEVVGRGLKSNGFMFYLADHPGDEELWSSGQQDLAYRRFLEWLGDALSEEVGVLFSSEDPANRLFPPHRVLEDVLELLNAEEIEAVWDEEETMGWVYQYYTPKELRDQARKESQSPRNSYELAFRNQFYTPDYVVRFLADNTLGRIWYEMRQGDTHLTGQCEYLVRRPDEVFLGEPVETEIAKAQAWLRGEGGVEPGTVHLGYTVNGYYRAPQPGDGAEEFIEEQLSRLSNGTAHESSTQELLDLLFLLCHKDQFVEGTLDDLAGEIEAIRVILRRRIELSRHKNLSQEERLRAPAFVPYRVPKDPRKLKILDPACGSGHFLLYCFDLLETIYEEAYADEILGEDLREEYPDVERFRLAVPSLILYHNLYGIDIDLRAIQIAALVLWLRAQRTHKATLNEERQRITRSNIVCAEPMPGERDMLEDFTRTLEPGVLAQLVEGVFDNMALAGEAGSLLKIEEEIKDAIAQARAQWQREFDRATDRRGNELLLTHSEMDRLSSLTDAQMDLFDVSQVTDEEFWDRAAEQVTETLESYATKASNGTGYQRGLFAEDAARGFAFVAICQERFDVVLMNPPFGEASKPSKPYIDKTYSRTKNDVYAAFVERGLEWLHPGGMLGAITSRTGFFLSSFRKWREEIVLGEARPTLVADLGQGVLDTAMVETAAYVLEKSR